MKRVTDEEFIDRYIRAAIAPVPVVCPMCGSNYVTDSHAGRRLGICEVCYMRRKADAKRIEAEERKAVSGARSQTVCR